MASPVYKSRPFLWAPWASIFTVREEILIIDNCSRKVKIEATEKTPPPFDHQIHPTLATDVIGMSFDAQ